MSHRSPLDLVHSQYHSLFGLGILAGCLWVCSLEATAASDRPFLERLLSI